ncbi:saccharopine dehydrogenase family protein [Flindersiella endophytica]
MTKIAVYGANGYTAKLVVTELAGRGFEPVLIGRNADRLRAVAAGVAGAEIRVARLSDHVALTDVFQDCSAVVNAVAPYVSYGLPVVRAAIAAGCHYVDFAGEQSYVQTVFDTFADDAERAGVAVVPMVNDGGFLADLIASLAAHRLAGVDELTIAHRIREAGGLTRGSARTALANRDLFTSVEPAKLTMTFPGGETAVMVSFALPELVTLPRHLDASRILTLADEEIATLFSSLTPELAERLPADGPPEQDRRAARFVIVADAMDTAGRRVRGIVEGQDTYGTTAFNAAEAVQRLANGTAEPGVRAPAQAFDPADFLDSLAVQGIRWRIEP